MIRGMKVTVYPYGNPEKEAEGIAYLIEMISESEHSEKWLVQFDGEHKLEKRTIRKPEEEPPEPKPLKLVKRSFNGTVKYYYPPGGQPRKPNERLGQDRTDHSELKYQYLKTRNKNSRT